MGSTSFELFFLPLLQGVTFWFLIMAAARLILGSAVHSMHRLGDQDHRARRGAQQPHERDPHEFGGL
jgi:hypothetical protein